MESTPNDRLTEEQVASLEEQLLNLAREAGVIASNRPTSINTSRIPPATPDRPPHLRYVALAAALLVATLGLAVWWWSSPATRTKTTASEATTVSLAGSKDATPTAAPPPSESRQQLQATARDLAALRQAVEQLRIHLGI